MSKLTVSANGGAMPAEGQHTRRAVLGFLTAAPALALPAVAAIAAPPPVAALAGLPALSPDLTADDRRAVALWEGRAALRPVIDRLRRAEDRAAARLPWWAKPGPEMLRADGSFTGDVTTYTADPDAVPPEEGLTRRIRPSEYQARLDFEADASFWGRAAAQKRLDKQLAKIAALKARRREAEEVAGYAKAARALAQRLDQVRRIEAELQALPATSPHVAAARLFLEAAWQCSIHTRVRNNGEMAVAVIGLTALRERLTGRLRRDVDEILDRPGRKIVNYGASVTLRASLPREVSPYPATLAEARGS